MKQVDVTAQSLRYLGRGFSPGHGGRPSGPEKFRNTPRLCVSESGQRHKLHYGFPSDHYDRAKDLR